MANDFIKAGLLLVFCQAACGADPASVNDTPEARLRYMQKTGKSYNVRVGESPARRPVTIRDKPVLRFTNAVSGVVDGGLFLWDDPSGRPVAAAQLFIIPETDDVWLHEFQSLSTRSLDFRYEGRSVWTPDKAGVEFRPFPGAPKPAKSSGARLLQMRRLASQFSVHDAFEGDDEDRLRLLSTPIARYQPGKDLEGAVFVFAHGTDPELFVILETLPIGTGGESPVWQVAFAPMTAYALSVELRGESIWEVGKRPPPFELTDTFINFVYPPR